MNRPSVPITSPAIRSTALALALLVSGPIAAEAFAPASYHANNCTRCHDSTVYTRENRRVGSYPALQAMVARCDANLGAQLFPEDLTALVDYLNDNYYQFAD